MRRFSFKGGGGKYANKKIDAFIDALPEFYLLTHQASNYFHSDYSGLDSIKAVLITDDIVLNSLVRFL
ncbi:hypothetical protein LINGRAPRIM_LOCUS357 [Linum grandiflorum]